MSFGGLQLLLSQLSGSILFPRPVQLLPLQLPSLVDVGFTTTTEPVTETVAWQSVSGVDDIEIIAGSIEFGASAEEKTLTGVSLNKSGRHYIISLSEDVEFVSISLSGFTYIPSGDNQSITFSASSSSRLVVAIPNDQTQWLPVYCVPYLSSSSTPKQYAGATYSNNTIRFTTPMPPVKKLRLSVVKNFAKDNEELLDCHINSGTIRIRNLPVDLAVNNDINEEVLYEQNGLLQSAMPNVQLDLINPALVALREQLANEEDLRFSYTISARTDSAFHYKATTVSGALLRTFSGNTKTVLEGEPQLLALDTSNGLLDDEQPSTVTADIVVNYEQLRVLELLNDGLPVSQGSVSGYVIKEEGEDRVILDADIAQYPIDRIGVIGRAPEDCELSLSLLAQSNNSSGEQLTTPGVVQLTASTDIQVVWIALPEPITYDGPIVLHLRANSGRFFWVTNPQPDGQPAVKVVVQDEFPGGREISINNKLLVNLEQSRLHYPGIAILPEIFSSTLPELSSNLFVTVELSDLTLRYSR